MKRYEFIYGSSGDIYLYHKKAFGISKIILEPSTLVRYEATAVPFEWTEKYSKEITEKDYEDIKTRNKYSIFMTLHIVDGEVFGFEDEDNICSIVIEPDKIIVTRPSGKIDIYET